MKKAILTLLALAAFAGSAAAIDAPIISGKRLSIAAQVGVDWLRATNAYDGVQTKPAVKLVPSYSVFGPANGNFAGSVSFSFPAKLTLNADHRYEQGAYISIGLWSGTDVKR